MDYSKLLPLEPPKGLIEWTIKQVKPMDALVYRAWEEYEPITEQKWKGVRVTCTSCDTTFTAERVDTGGCRGKTSFGFLLPEGIVGDGSKAVCPYCGGQVNVLHCSSISKYGTQNMWRTACSLHKLGDKLALVSWIIVQTIYKDDKSCEAYTDTGFYRYEAYVMEDRKLVRLAGYDKFYNQLHFNAGWTQRKRFSDELGECDLIFPPSYAAMQGTEAENSKLDLYMAAECDRHWPVEYLNAYVKHKNIENIVSAGNGKLLAWMLDETVTYGGFYGQKRQADHRKLPIDWKKVKPSEMLGLTKEELRRAKAENWSLNTLKVWKVMRKYGYTPDEKQLKEVSGIVGIQNVEDIAKRGVSPIKAANYLKTPGRYARLLTDYYNLIEVTPENAFPHDLKEAHDRAAETAKILADEKKNAKFRSFAEEHEDLEWTDGELVIVLPRSVQELIDEGKTLHQCVGGYADHHIKGNSIFFVRHYRRPDRSWYTLNIDLRGKEPREIQLHGYRNDMKCPVPEKVRAFVDRWKAEILTPWFYKNQNKTTKEKAA